MVEKWTTKIHGDHFYPLLHTQYILYHTKSNTRTTGVWKRHGTAHIIYGRLGAIEQQRQKEMGRNNRRENASKIRSHDYKVGDKVLLKKPGKHIRKLEAPRTGPHTVTAIYTNRTLRIQKGKVNERVNIRRLFPYFENADH
jgi:hypothetical protein